MWKQEKVVDRVLCYRHSVDDDFIPYNVFELTRKCQKQKDDISYLIDECNQLQDEVNDG